MIRAMLSPFDLSAATQTGARLFRKQILRKGTINYKGQKVTFDEPFLQNVVKAFRRGAYDQVPFVLADPDNRHNMDPERFRGEVKGMELTRDGVDAIIEATPEGAKVIKRNPRLGVSARIVTDMAKADGRSYPVAIQHVLATMDPRLTGMRPWETVDLSDEDEDVEVIDLTAAIVKEGTMATKTRKKAAAKPKEITFDLSQLSDEQFEILLSTAVVEDDTDTDEDDETEETVTSKTSVKRKGFKKTASVDDEEDEEDDEEDLEEDEDDEDDEESSDESDDEDEEDEDEEETPKPVSKKSKAKAKAKRKTQDLSTPVKRKKVSAARQVQISLAETRWDAQRDKLARSGVPPFLLDLAEPIMKTPDRLVIDLSETGEENVDAKKVIAGLLEGVRGVVDLSEEIGSTIGGRPDKETSTGKMLDRWDMEYGKP
jgi:hypothetical protein